MNMSMNTNNNNKNNNNHNMNNNNNDDNSNDNNINNNDNNNNNNNIHVIGEKYWDYCSAHDYRFQKEILENVPKDGPLKYESNGYKENKIISFNETKNSKSNNNINNNNHNNLDKDNNKEYSLPINCYDFIEGYYDPARNILCSHITKSDIRVPTEKEVEWILKNCRIGK